MRILLLSQFALEDNGKRFEPMSSYKASALLALLSYYPGRVFSREVLAELFWPEVTPVASRTSLRGALFLIRELFSSVGVEPDTVIQSSRTQISFNQQSFITDVMEFMAAMQLADQAKHPHEKLSYLSKAVSMYSGDLLPGYYESWVSGEREKLAEMYLSALRQIEVNSLSTGDKSSAIAALKKIITADPVEEEAYLRLMRLYMEEHRPDLAVTLYQRLETTLKQQMEISPSAEAQELAASLSIKKSAHKPNIPDDLSLNADQTKDEKPSQENLVNNTSLPQAMNSFRGRSHETDWLVQTLKELNGFPRIITLTGPGGIGKTTLAVEVANWCRLYFAGRILFVSLTEISTADKLPAALLEAMGINHIPALTPLDQFHQVVGETPFLLILDNMEQLVTSEQAGAVRKLLLTLCKNNPHLRCLATSRIRLNVRGEQCFPVPPLAVPSEKEDDITSIANNEAVSLFLDRARETRHDFTLTVHNMKAIVALCSKFEGIPLAIELAAGWVWALSPQQMLERFNNSLKLQARNDNSVLERHRTMRAILNESYALLSEIHAMVLRHMAIFKGGCSLEAIAAICSQNALLTGSLEDTVLFSLSSLLDHSLVAAVTENDEEMRYRLLEPVREFAEELLKDTDEEESAREKHLNYYFHFADQWALRLIGPDSLAALTILRREQDNIRAALEYGLSSPDYIDICARFVSALVRFWHINGNWHEGRDYLSRVIEALDISLPADLVIKCLHGAGMLAYAQGDYNAATLLIHKANGLVDSIDNPVLKADILSLQALVAYAQGDYTGADSILRTALEIRSILNDTFGSAQCLNYAGMVEAAKGNRNLAIKSYRESLILFRELRDKASIAQVLYNMGAVGFAMGDYEQTREWTEESLAIRRSIADKGGVCASLTTLANLNAMQGDLDTSEQLNLEALSIRREIGNLVGAAHSYINLGLIYYYRGDNTTAKDYYLQSLRIRRDAGDLRGTADTLMNMGILYYAQKHFYDAEQQYDEALQLYRKMKDASGVASCLVNLAGLAEESGNLALAVKYYQESLESRRERGDQKGIALCLYCMGLVELQRNNFESAREYLKESLEIRIRIGGLTAILESITGITYLLISAGKMEHAIQLAAYLEKNRGELGMPLNGPEAERWNYEMNNIKAALDAERVEKLYADGVKLNKDEALQLVSDILNQLFTYEKV